MPEKCHAINCTKPSVSKGLCDTHRKRLARHGSVEQTRPADWGAREKHAAYQAWCGLRRYHRAELPDAWQDFWGFVTAVPPKPGKAIASRADPDKPWGADNFYWKVSRVSVSKRDDHAEYMRQWHRAARAADPDYGRNLFLKRAYGVSLDWYNAKHEEQGGVCAICKREETTVIRGKTILLAVDHCHDTGEVRGLLCAPCNRAIGFLDHDTHRLRAAISYLEGTEQ